MRLRIWWDGREEKDRGREGRRKARHTRGMEGRMGRIARHTNDDNTRKLTVMKFGLVLKKKGHDVLRLGPGRDLRFSVSGGD